MVAITRQISTLAPVLARTPPVTSRNSATAEVANNSAYAVHSSRFRDGPDFGRDIPEPPRHSGRRTNKENQSPAAGFGSGVLLLGFRSGR